MDVWDFNLLISTWRGEEMRACLEARRIFERLGDEEVTVYPAQARGLVTVKTKFNPFEAVEKLRKLYADTPEVFRLVLKVVPVQKVVESNIEKIRKAARELASQIEENEKFRVTVEKRRNPLYRHDVIVAAADEIDRDVDLKNPDKTLLIEIIGTVAGISVIKSSEIFSTHKVKFRML